MIIQTTEENFIITGRYFYHDSGNPNLGLLVVLYRLTNNSEEVNTDYSLIEVGRYVTKSDGVYRIEIPIAEMPTGDYELRTYGSFTIPQYDPIGDWRKFHFENPNDPSIGIPDLVFSSLPNFNVSETADTNEIVVNTDKTEITTAVFDITGIDILEGRIANVIIEYKRYGLSESAFLLLGSFPVDGNSEPSSLQFKSKISLYLKPTCYYDFRCFIQGVNGEWATYDNTKVSLEALNIPFDGVTDLPDYIEVRDLEVTNASDPESGVLPGEYAELIWEEIRQVALGMFPISLKNGATGINYNISYNQAQRISGYGVFMYVTTSGIAPENSYPVSGLESEGMWYYMGDFEKVNAKIRCPEGTSVSFWVGMRSHNTNSSIIKHFIKF